jgi:conjugal transfer ATP-binding protein TraC
MSTIGNSNGSPRPINQNQNRAPIGAPQPINPQSNNGGQVYQTPQLAQNIRQNTNVQGAYGNYAQNGQNRPPQGPNINATSGHIAQNIRQPNQQLPNPANRQQPYPQNQNRPQQPLNRPPVAPLNKGTQPQLQNMSAQDLRKEVIKTEIDIQKTLIESEKAYREGVSTIRDLIAPSSVKISTGVLEIGTKFVRTFFVLVYPRVISSGWLEGIVNADIPMDLSIFVYPKDSSEILKELKNKVGKIQASLNINQERGQARDPQLETAYRDVEALRDAIQQGVEKFFRVGVYITVYGDSLAQLDKYSESVESMLSQQNIIMKRAALQMDDGFNSSMPILRDDLNVLSNMNTGPLSASFPFVSSELSSNDGVLFGINRHNTSLVIFDRFELENANSLVFATSGAGKSYAVKLEILRSLMVGTSVIVIDPENEYKTLADTLGGAYVSLSLNSPNRINPFDLPKPLPGENVGDILRTAIIDLMGLMNLMVGKMNPTEESLMEQAITQAYAKRDITSTADLSDKVVPTMEDLVQMLEGTVGGESLAQRLYKYTQGTFSGIFNSRTNVNINKQFIVFNIRDLQDTLRPIGMYILLKFVWAEVRSELKRRILAVDEAWIMMQNEDSAKFLFGLAKRARKYYLGVTTITQDVGDFLSSPYGKPIVTNAAMKLLLKQSNAAIDTVGDTFGLTGGEKQLLLNSGVGQGIFFAGPRHVAIEIIAFPTEHKIITTNPKDLLKIQGLEELGE